MEQRRNNCWPNSEFDGQLHCLLVLKVLHSITEAGKGLLGECFDLWRSVNFYYRSLKPFAPEQHAQQKIQRRVTSETSYLFITSFRQTSGLHCFEQHNGKEWEQAHSKLYRRNDCRKRGTYCCCIKKLEEISMQSTLTKDLSLQEERFDLFQKENRQKGIWDFCTFNNYRKWYYRLWKYVCIDAI